MDSKDRFENPVFLLSAVTQRYFLTMLPESILCSSFRFFAEHFFLVSLSSATRVLLKRSFFFTALFLLGVSPSSVKSFRVWLFGVRSASKLDVLQIDVFGVDVENR